MLLSRFVREVVCPFLAATGSFCRACRAQTGPGSCHPAQVPLQPPFSSAQESWPQPLPAPLPSAGKVLGTAPGPFPALAPEQLLRKELGWGQSTWGQVPPHPGALSPLEPPRSLHQPGCAQLSIQTGCRGAQGAGGSLGALGAFSGPSEGLRAQPGGQQLLPSFPLCSSATFAAPRAGAGDGGAGIVPVGALGPGEGKKAAVKITPGPAPAHCGFLRFTALPRGKRQEPAGFDPFTATGEGARGTFPPSFLPGWGAGGIVVGSCS